MITEETFDKNRLTSAFAKAIILVFLIPFIALGQGNGLYEFIGENWKYGFMDKNGKVIIPAKYIYVKYPGFSEGLAFVSEKKFPNGDFDYYCIDTLGRKVFDIGRYCSPRESFAEGYAVIRNWEQGKYWFIDKKGKQVFNKKFERASKFTNGFARVEDGNSDNSHPYFINKNGEAAKHLPTNCSIFINGISFCGTQLIDTLGNVLIDSIHAWTGASDEILKVKRDDKWGFIDRKGNIIIDFQYEEDRNRFMDKALNLNTDSLDALPKATYRNVGFFREGLASIQKDSLFGFINLKNEVVIEPIFREVRWFSEGLAGATLDGIKWGFINKKGEFVIEPQYYLVDAFEHGVCGVKLTNMPRFVNDYYLNAIIDKNNKIIYRGEMHSYGGFRGELIKYYEAGDYRGRIHYVNKKGKLVLPKE